MAIPKPQSPGALVSSETVRSEAKSVDIQGLSAWYGTKLAIDDVTMSIVPNAVTAIIGPSGCGKSTLVRCVNRMHEVVPGARVSGKVMLEDEDIYAAGIDPVMVRRRIGMVFQRANPFPTMSIFDNVASGLRLNGLSDRRTLPGIVEKSLRQAALWDEVKDKLGNPGTDLSGGQQQRLCIARALAVEPEVLLMDEPASALDPVATLKIEELMQELKRDYTIMIVTHNMQQAARVSEHTAFMLAGEDRVGRLIEYGDTSRIFTNPKDKRTEDYITGRFG
jgi:phosphate transport system ATP-binding protein